jgi:hypothetical protein
MITLNELRIGNLFIGYDDKVFELSLQHYNILWCDVSIDEIIKSPIPITEEWLLKFGFEEQMRWTYKINLNGNLNLVYYVGEKGVSINNKQYSDFQCTYTHQLQNIYFSLTGKELTLSVP